ncbi:MULTISPECIES: hypothetical protein [unclassified Luteococcus]|uniref:hypothetical protein n=1 Tax=unclassified Luteococcus TaxID=2639923 RepID=UPI00313B8540
MTGMLVFELAGILLLALPLVVLLVWAAARESRLRSEQANQALDAAQRLVDVEVRKDPP